MRLRTNMRSALPWAWLLLAMPAGTVASMLPLRLPFEASVESVIDAGEIEGRAVRVARFRSPEAPDDIVQALRREWPNQDGARLIETASGGWRVVSTWDPDKVRTLQLRALPGGGSEGLISLWPSAAAASGVPAAAFDLAALLPSGATVLRRFAARDAGRRSETLVAVVPMAVEDAAAAIDQALAARGLRAEPRMAGGSAQRQARLYRGPGIELAMTLAARGQGAELVLHLTGGKR